MKGKLIVLEGIDGAGKATQAKLLAKRLRAEGIPLTTFKSPRYETPTGKIVKNALMGKYGDFVNLPPYISALPYLLDFSAAQKEITAALKRGAVLCDRYIQSTLAFHSAKIPNTKKRRQFIKDIERIMYQELELPRPDLIIYVDTPPHIAQKLLKNKKDQHEKNMSYQKRVAKTYASLATGGEWRTVHCIESGKILSPKIIHERIWRIVQTIL